MQKPALRSLILSLLVGLLVACGGSNQNGATGDGGSGDQGGSSAQGADSGDDRGGAGSAAGAHTGGVATGGAPMSGGDAGSGADGSGDQTGNGDAGTESGGMNTGGSGSGGDAPGGAGNGNPGGSGNAGNANGGQPGNPTLRSLGGTLSGLPDGTSVVLQNNSGDDLTLSGNGPFAFAKSLAEGSNYAVTVKAQPLGQTCVIVNGSGKVGGANVTSVGVTCSTNVYSVGGTVTGLGAGKTLLLRNNGHDDLSLSANGTFTFPTSIASGDTYTVSVFMSPAGQTCSAANNTGIVTAANITTVQITCSVNSHTVGGTLSGLPAGKNVELLNNGSNSLQLSQNGAFTFSANVADGANYSVTVGTSPTTVTCSVSNGGGTINGANVTSVTVTCSLSSYTVGGTVTGLGVNKALVLRNNGTDDLILTSNGSYKFPTTVISGGNYAVTIQSQPTGQSCHVTNGSGTVQAANVTNIVVNCAVAYYVGGGSATLGSGKTLVLQNNGKDNLTLTGPIANGGFTFNTAVLDGGTYNVTVLTQPAGQTCTVANGQGTVAGANVNTVTVTCSQLTLKVNAPNIASSGMTVLAFSGSTLVAGRSNISVDASGNGTFLLSTGSSSIASVTLNPPGFPAALDDGLYSVFVQVDKSNNGVLPNNTDDWNYFGSVTIAGPTTLTLGNADFKPYQAYNLTVTGQSNVANRNYFCAAHLPGGDVFQDYAQRNFMGLVTGRIDANGNGTVVKAAMAVGTFDVNCLADSPNATSGALELQPYSLSTGKGVDKNIDSVASLVRVQVAGAGSQAVSGFTPANFDTGTVACSGSYTSGGTGATGSFNGNNNSSLLSGNSGCVLGTYASTHKAISVSAPTGTGAGHYTFGSAYLSNRVGKSFTMVVPLTNSSGSGKGAIGVSLSSVIFSGSAAPITASYAKMAAATCVLGSNPISTCLGAGETGYLLVTSSAGFDTVSSVTFTISDSTVAPTGINSKVIPQTFTRYADGELRFRITNQGTGNADLSTLSTTNLSFAIPLDQNGNPSDWLVFSNGIVDHVLPGNHIAGSTAPTNSIVLVVPNYNGVLDNQSAQAKVFVSFGDTATAPQ